jgi:hypothetical protein
MASAGSGGLAKLKGTPLLVELGHHLAAEIGLLLREGIERAAGAVALDHHRRLRGGGRHRLVGGVADQPEEREEQDQGQRIAPDDRLAAADPVRERAEQDEPAEAQQSRAADDQLRRPCLDTHRAGEEGQGREHGRIPDHRQPGRDAEQGDEQPLQIARVAEAFQERVVGGLARLLHRLEDRALGQLEPHPERNGEQQQRHQERHTPAPAGPAFGRHAAADHQDDGKAEDETARDRRLNVGGVVAGSPRAGMFGDVDRRAAIFAPERQALKDAQEDEQDRGRDADRRRGGIRPTPAVASPSA